MRTAEEILEKLYQEREQQQKFMQEEIDKYKGNLSPSDSILFDFLTDMIRWVEGKIDDIERKTK